MIFNDYDFSQYWRVRMERPLLPQINVTETEIPGQPGAVFVRADLETVDIDVEMRLKLPKGMTDPVTVNWVKRQAAAALAATEPKELRFYEEPDRVYHAICTDASGFDEPTFTGLVELEFHLCDPLAYYTLERVHNMVVGANTVDIKGAWSTFPRFHLTANAGSRVKVECGSKHVDVPMTFTGGEEVEMDFQKGFVWVDGVLAQYTLSSDFFELSPGSNTITVTGATGTMAYSERSV